MTRARLMDVKLPDFGVPEEIPVIGDAIYKARLDQLRKRMDHAGLNAIVVYADREHTANFTYLTGFDPRFEEALFILSAGRDPVIITGPENLGRARASKNSPSAILSPTFGLMGQDRTKTPSLVDLLSNAGIQRRYKVGVAGWKYFISDETPGFESWSEVPSFIIDTLRHLVGEEGRVINAGRLFMDSETGLRAINEIDQLAQFEFAACHASEAIKKVLFGVRPGMREMDAARLMALGQYPLSAHPMLSSGQRAYAGLESPSDRVINKGDPMTTALGLWGGLTARAGWVAESADDLPHDVRDYIARLAAPYFETAAAWYEMIGIGVKGGDLYRMVWDRLGDPFFGLILNPGHLIHIDEWMNTPIYRDSQETLRSHQAIQLDIIPATGSSYFTTNIEDGVILLDEEGRAAFAEKYPEAWRRIETRRAYMLDVLGIKLKPETLPLSNLAGYLPPFFLSPKSVLVRK